MPASRGSNDRGADPAKLREWQLERKRARYDRNRGADEIPIDLLDDPAAARRAIADLD